MNILHVSLGNPKYHSGGLNQYCLDLMNEQKKMGHNVFLLYPGSFNITRKTVVKRMGNGKYSIENPLPVAITYGIDDPNRYMKAADKKLYESFLQSISPDVIHIHSIQGIHAEFFEAAKSKSIPMIFTTHDYYPMCYKCTLMNWRSELCESNDPSKCAVCNYGEGLTIKKQIVLHSECFQKLKKSCVVQFLKKKKKPINSDEKTATRVLSNEELEMARIDFGRLKNYYERIVQCFDIIHANSEQSAEIYKNFFPNSRVIVVPISNTKLIRQKHRRNFEQPINFGYLGGPVKYKGYEIIEKALECLDKSGQRDWNAWFYGGKFCQPLTNDKRRHYFDRFNADSAEEVWKKIDVLVVPSQWKETFGFVVLEALSKEIPVICSNLVGASYLLEKAQCPELIFNYKNVGELSEKMGELISTETYRKTQRKIEKMDWEYDMKCHTNEMLSVYREVLDKKKTS